MHWRDHAPAHFHARYQDAEVAIAIESGEVTGRMSGKALALIEEWRLLHRVELLEDWRRAMYKERLIPIAPLE